MLSQTLPIHTCEACILFQIANIKFHRYYSVNQDNNDNDDDLGFLKHKNKCSVYHCYTKEVRLIDLCQGILRVLCRPGNENQLTPLERSPRTL